MTSNTPANAAVAEQVQQAFTAARSGDYQRVSDLASLGVAIIPHLAPYLNDENTVIRLQAVALLNSVNDPAAISLLADALVDAEQDVRNQASVLLYQNYDPNTLANDEALGRALRHSINQGNDAAAALLLLSYFPSDESREVLQALAVKARESAMTELFTWSPVVPVQTVVEVALSRIGDANARLALLQKIEKEDAQTLEFLLAVLREIDAPEVLHSLAGKTLTNTTETGAGVPSGAGPRRQLRDLAVDAFVKRLQLSVDFELSEHRRYADIEIDQVLQQLRNTLPR